MSLFIDNIMDVLENNMKFFQDQISIKYLDKNITYKELDSITYKIALFLQDNSLGVEDIVAIYMDRSWLSVCATIGVLRAGAAFLPIDKKTPIDRVKRILKISKTKLVICDKSTNVDTETRIANINQILSRKSDNKLCRTDVSSLNIAYVIFTSGSTGEPKGAMLEHGGMINHLHEKIKLLDINKNSVIAHNASISFDISVWQILAPLCTGGTVAIFPEESLVHIKKFIDILWQDKISVLEVVPSYLSLLINEFQKKRIELDNLKYVISTGQELTSNLARRWHGCFPDIPLVNAYGPTEASDDISHFVIQDSNEYETIPIGKPINGASFSVMNSDGRQCVDGKEGELWVSGTCVGRGYIGNDVETQKHFFLDKETGKRVYKTGDLVSKGPDGNFYYHGRKDSQIKMHGNRIEIKEIENTIMSFNEIIETAVIFDNDKEQLTAVYTTETLNLQYSKLKEYLSKKLPPYMIPVTFKKVDKIPVNTNGKTDYKKIAEYLSGIDNNLEAMEVQDGIENTLKKIVLEIINAEQLPDDDSWKNDMSTVGFDSISTIKLIIAVEEAYGFEFGDEMLLPEILYNFNKICDYAEKNAK